MCSFIYTSHGFNSADPGRHLQPTSKTIQTLCPAPETALVAEIRPHGCHWTPASSGVNSSFKVSVLALVFCFAWGFFFGGGDLKFWNIIHSHF